MKKLKRSVLKNTISTKGKRLVALSFSGVLTAGAVVATAAFVASDKSSSTKTTNVENLFDHDGSQIGSFVLDSGAAIPASAPALNDETVESEDFSDVLNGIEADQFKSLLGEIQGELINKLTLEMRVTGTSLAAITISRYASLANARVDFARDLGLTGIASTVFFNSLNQILSRPEATTNTGHSLRSGIGFSYTREGATSDGTTHAKITAIYNFSRSDSIVTNGVEPAAIPLKVTGLSAAGKPDQNHPTDPAKVALAAQVANEVRRFTEPAVTGRITSPVNSAAADLQVTSLSLFGVNVTLDNDKFIYKVTHVAMTATGSYPVFLTIFSKTDPTIHSDPITIVISVSAATSGPIAQPGTDNINLGAKIALITLGGIGAGVVLTAIVKHVLWRGIKFVYIKLGGPMPKPTEELVMRNGKIAWKKPETAPGRVSPLRPQRLGSVTGTGSSYQAPRPTNANGEISPADEGVGQIEDPNGFGEGEIEFLDEPGGGYSTVRPNPTTSASNALYEGEETYAEAIEMKGMGTRLTGNFSTEAEINTFAARAAEESSLDTLASSSGELALNTAAEGDIYSNAMIPAQKALQAAIRDGASEGIIKAAQQRLAAEMGKRLSTVGGETGAEIGQRAGQLLTDLGGEVGTHLPIGGVSSGVINFGESLAARSTSVLQQITAKFGLQTEEMLTRVSQFSESAAARIARGGSGFEAFKGNSGFSEELLDAASELFSKMGTFSSELGAQGAEEVMATLESLGGEAADVLSEVMAEMTGETVAREMGVEVIGGIVGRFSNIVELATSAGTEAALALLEEGLATGGRVAAELIPELLEHLI